MHEDATCDGRELPESHYGLRNHIFFTSIVDHGIMNSVHDSVCLHFVFTVEWFRFNSSDILFVVKSCS